MSVGVSPEEDLPGLATAFDEEAVKSHLQEALFGPGPRDYVVERCTPRRPLYVPGESCLLRYRFRARNAASGDILEPIVTGRIFPNRSRSEAYLREKLGPLVARVRDRSELAAFAAPAALIEPLSMVVQVWPLDGELPTLVDATDPERMVRIFEQAVPVAVESCRVELVSYRRRQRCVLRYTVVDEGGQRLVAYGKVSAVGNDTPKDKILESLRRRASSVFAVPRSLAWRPELQLSLLEALPGEAKMVPALEARLRGNRDPGELSLEEMIETSGRVAAALHGSGVTLGPTRTLDDELAGLEREAAAIHPFVPALGERARGWLEEIAASAERSEPFPPCLTHGDFKHEQLLFDGGRSGLVDFDAVGQAEPALDLGKFVAHLRTEAAGREPVADELANRFLAAYPPAGDERRLRARTALYEAVALVRLALRGQQDLDEPRVRMTSDILEERLANLARG